MSWEIHHTNGACAQFPTMKCLFGFRFFLMTMSWLSLSFSLSWAEAGVLVVHVKDVQRRAIKGVEIGVEGDGGSAITGDDGKARIRLAKQTKEKSWVSLQILRSPPTKDFVMVSPWDYKTLVPSFENESENFVDVVLIQRGDRAALENGGVLAAITAQINEINARKSTSRRTSSVDLQASLTAVATKYGLTPNELDRAIRAWGERVKDPFELGLAALYERDYSKSTAQLEDSLRMREESLAEDQMRVAAAAFFLGVSLFEQGKYRESTLAYQRALELRKDDNTILVDLGASLLYAGDYRAAEDICRRSIENWRKASPFRPDDLGQADDLHCLATVLAEKGDYAGAEPLYRRELEIAEQLLGADNPRAANAMIGLAFLFYASGKFGEAEEWYRKALVIHEKAAGPMTSQVACDLDDLANVLKARGRYSEANLLYRRALDIRERTLGPDHPEVAMSVTDLASFLEAMGDYSAAESLFRRGLLIRRNALGPEHPQVAESLNDLAELLRKEGDFAAAESLFRQSLAIGEKTLGPNHPSTGIVLSNLGLVLHQQKRYREAEALYRRALDVYETSLGQDHPLVATVLANLAGLLANTGDFGDALPLARRALAIDEKALGMDHPDVAERLNTLGGIAQSMGDLAEAESLYRRALAIDEKALGPDHPDVAIRLTNIASLLQAKGDDENAEALFARALALNERALGRDHPSTKLSRERLQNLRLSTAKPK
jgi:tetratricopeptide (TPR) repeat protein